MTPFDSLGQFKPSTVSLVENCRVGFHLALERATNTNDWFLLAPDLTGTPRPARGVTWSHRGLKDPGIPGRMPVAICIRLAPRPPDIYPRIHKIIMR